MEDAQVYIVVIQVLLGLLLALLAFFLNSIHATLKDVQRTAQELNQRMHVEFATKAELRERVHGVRGALGVHSTWIHILAHKGGVALPGQNNKGDDN